MITHTMVETATDTWQRQEWRVMPFNVPNLLVDPPAAMFQVVTRQSEFEEPVGTYRILLPFYRRAVDPHTHGVLLEESLRDYGDIWRTLAQR